jgi:hypothetical protein
MRELIPEANADGVTHGILVIQGGAPAVVAMYKRR